MARHARARDFFTEEEEARIVAAIAAAERRTSGEIRVHVESHCRAEDAMTTARTHFRRLGMERTAARNGVLFYLATRDGAFAVVGDEGIHRQVGDEFWTALRDRMAERFRQDDFAGGLEEAIGAVGERLASAFPCPTDDRNELTDDISYPEAP